MRRHVDIFLAYFTQFLKVRLSYRGDFFVALLTSFAATVFGFGFLLILLRNVQNLAGWSPAQAAFLYGFSLIPFGLFNVTSLNLYDFGNDYIIEGKFDRVLLRPISTLFQVIFESFRIESFQEVITGLVAVWWAGRLLDMHWTAADVLLLIFFGICGWVIYTAIFLILTSVTFWFEDRIGIHPPVWNMIAFGRYPLSIYSGFIQFTLSWIIPFGFASFYPTVRLLGRAEFRHYAPLVPLVAIAFSALALAIWQRGVRHYSSTGS